VTHCWEPKAENTVFKKQVNDSLVKQRAANFLDHSTGWQKKVEIILWKPNICTVYMSKVD